jgi:uncharacterized protein with PhoU and TrkA domain
MIKVKQIKHSVIAGLQGAQEGILEIADRINHTVLKAKLMLEMNDLEEQLKKNYLNLGKLAFQLKADQDLNSMNENVEVKNLLETCRAHEAKLSRLRQIHHELSGNQFDDQLNLLKQLLEQKKLQIIKLTLRPTSPFKGRTLHEIQLPPDLLVLCVQKRNRLMIANGDTRLDEQDQLLVLGSEMVIKRMKDQF